MKRLLWLALAACGPTAAPRVELAAAPSASVAPAPPPPAEAIPAGAAAIRSGDRGAWARTIREAPKFRRVDLPGASRVLLTWRIGASRTLKPLPPEEDYGANHVSVVDLVVRARGGDTVIPLGELPGSPVPANVTYCRNRGYHVDTDGAIGASAPDQANWGFPKEPNVASAFMLDMIQGGDDFLLVRDGGTLHLLHRETSDGSCNEGKQGPLAICEGSEYARVAEIHVGAADLFETIDGEGKPFDCTAERWGQRLVFG